MEESDVHIELDVGNLLVSSITELNPTNQNDQNEAWLKSLAQRGVQSLVDKIFELPIEYQEHTAVVKLPMPTTLLPREKPVPKAKPPTRWEEYARKKGITRKKKENLVWHDATKEWKPRWGYRSVKADKSDWLVEVPQNGDPNADYFALKKEKKVESVAKNEYQRLRNIAVSHKVKVRNLESADIADKEQLSRSISSSKTATASVGKFVDKLSKEKPPKNMGKKRKFESNFANNMKFEAEHGMQILDDINKKKPKFDVKEAVEKHMLKTGKNCDSDKMTEKKGKSKNKNNHRNSKIKHQSNKFNTPNKKKHVKGQNFAGKTGKRRK